MKKTITQAGAFAALALVLVLSMATLSEARGYGKGNGMHHFGPEVNLTPENQAKYDAIFKEFYDRMTPVGEKMMAKRLELNALQGNTNADPKQIGKLAEEIAALHTQMIKEREALDERFRKELGIDAPMRGMGRGGMGHGRGMGYGGGMGHGGGMGRGDGMGYGGGNGSCPRN